ncbi:hypothetical protein AB0A66_26260 [Streptomyces longwoodensis]|uniref:hypothetical protein n=1 Tax=Streptomyces longwoodensis TaxID=68231 RepID=UPI0033FF27DF
MSGVRGYLMTSAGVPAQAGGTSATAGQRDRNKEIGLLLEEYRTLREEIIHRVAGRMQMIGFAGIISALLVVSDRLHFDAPSFYVAILVLVVALLWLRGINRAIQRIGLHLRHLEVRINDLAAQGYGSTEPVLSWETAAQAGRMRVKGVPGYVGRFGGWYDRADRRPPAS